MLSGQAVDFLANIVKTLNQEPDLDFVLITGDLFFDATRAEFDLFQETVRTLQKPHYVIPGNHDRRASGSDQGLTRLLFARHFNPQFEARQATGAGQPGYWSLAVSPEVQLIGLDSVLDDDWGGYIEPPQLAWLQDELAAHPEKVVIVAVHHPLHVLAPVDHYPRWRNFVCRNGPEVLGLLDRWPQVKVVLTGHHHVTRVDTFPGRVHLACPAVSIYPCAYRLFRLVQQSGRPWQLEWQTRPATDAETIAEARQRMISAWTEGIGFNPNFVEAYADRALGRPADQSGRVVLSDTGGDLTN